MIRRLSILAVILLGAASALRGQAPAAFVVPDVRMYGAKCDGVTNDAAAITSALTAASTTTGEVFIPQGTCITNSSLTIPNKVHIFGISAGDNGGVGSVIKAGASFPVSTPVLIMGTTPNSFSVQITDLTVNCNALAGVIGIQNNWGQENSYVQHVGISACLGTGLDIETSGAQNSGPYENIFVNTLTGALAATQCIKVVGVTAMRAIRTVTCDATGFSVSPTYGISIDGPGGILEDIHLESVTNGIGVGFNNATYGLFAKNIYGNGTLTNVINIAPSGTNNVFGYTIIDLQQNGATNAITDGQIPLTIQAPSNGIIGFYACGDGVGKNKTCNTNISNQLNIFHNGVGLQGATSGNTATLVADTNTGTITLTAPTSTGRLNASTNLLYSPTAPTISAHFNTSGDSISANNGTAAFQVTVGNGVANSTGTVGLPTATTGWNCWANNINRADAIEQSGGTTSTAVFTNYGLTLGTPVNWTAGDVIKISCFAY